MSKLKQGPRLRAPSKKQLDREFAYFNPEGAKAIGIPPPPPEFIARMDREYLEYTSKAFPNMPPPPGYEQRMASALKGRPERAENQPRSAVRRSARPK